VSIWAQAAPYERYVGRWSRLVAREFIDWLGVAAEADWLDVGSGTGALAATVLDVASPASVTGVDP
jgi:ubiquinone/menaquinone biosynthesis C-methylase UbiE